MRPRTLVLSVAIAVLLAACGGGGDDAREARAADATGTVVEVVDRADPVVITFAPDAGGEYYDGARLTLATAGGLVDSEGEALTGADLAVGDRIEIWTEECAESFPVQCGGVLARLVVDGE
ncbi:hypothetical protein [Demequina pelophila]|uniref:hypothetical protein n=1 Tax=Demequina pelophila TaxID=1638984 RepID=UPI000781EFF3|nr:hypothetical protein [Demequina pelophila]